MGDRVPAPGRVDVSKAICYGLSAAFLLAYTFWLGVRAGIEHNDAFRFTRRLRTTIAGALDVTAGEFSTVFRTRPIHFLQASLYPGSGVTFNDPKSDQRDLILLAGFFKNTNELRLIHRDGSVVARWPVNYYDVFPNPDFFPPGWEPATDWNIDIHGALALPDGSVLFNFEWGGLVKLDRCGGVVWTVRRQTHHSVERAEAGGFWVPGRRLVDGPTPYPPFEPPFHEDTILRISDGGKILAEYSAVKIFYDAGLEAVLTANGEAFENGMEWDQEVVHLNKIEELTSDIAKDFPMFEAGDLAISNRDGNIVLVVDPKVSRVKWWQIGPWIRQHDPEFRRGGTIVLVNNNTHQTAFGDVDLKVSPAAPRVTNIMEVDPSTRMAKTIYGGRPGQELLTVIKGKVDLTAAGGLFITEAQGGRVRETDTSGKLVWEYVNRYDAESVAEIGEARLYPSDYFQVKDWSCP
jgi:arylsulfotransferase ASST